MTDKELADKICMDVTKVCKGIDLDAETKKQGGGGQTVKFLSLSLSLLRCTNSQSLTLETSLERAVADTFTSHPLQQVYMDNKKMGVDKDGKIVPGKDEEEL